MSDEPANSLQPAPPIGPEDSATELEAAVLPEERAPMAIVVCGALMREVREIVARQGWQADLFATPALNHISPKKLAADVDTELGLLAPYERVIVVYGDCGTGGVLDEVIERHGAVRLEGPHCYEMFGGDDAMADRDERPGLYWLTDWLVRNWDRAVVQSLGLDRWPFMKPVYFESVTDLVYLRQYAEPTLETKAREIAEYLELPLEIRDVGVAGLERRLVEAAQRAEGAN